MYTQAALIDIHTRTHMSFEKMLAHLDSFSVAELDKVFDGFGTGSLRQQIQHTILSEEYWIGVIRGEMITEERPEDAATLDALKAYRARMVEQTLSEIRAMTDEQLSTKREMTTWGGAKHQLAPAHIVMRTQTHIFQHLGQMTAIARLLGKPVPSGFDFYVR
jgi:uncharacterized damage-inducible protein DinB